ncbi:helix-turn-helix domain-containing protein [Aquimarina sp. 2201CG5-10]|uniref:helix-turn-helix domain-containing protein n=1 Tax=Aquimarina callyspongiae TaxID=3098150 RepID=UPI002AC9554F|nr:helix-turn-helix domain-containing protein [Aquimarina sp. 2201CG5-10]
MPFFLGIKLYAQQHIIIPDSVKNKTSEELVNHIKKSSSEESVLYEEALKIHPDPKLDLASIFYDIGYSFYKKGNFERSIKYLNQAIKIARKDKNEQLLCRTFLIQGNAYLQDWKNQKALDSYYSALEMAQKKGSLEDEIIANSGIVIIRRRMRQLDKALEVCKHALEITEKTSLKKSSNHVNLLTIISEIYLDKKQYDSVLHYAEIGIEMSKPIEYHAGLIDLYTKKGAVSFYRNDINKALTYLYQAEEIIETHKIDRKKLLKNLNYFFAYCFYKQEQYDKAISYLQTVIISTEEKDYRDKRVLEIYRLMADCYTALGNEKESVHWLQKHAALQDKFLQEKDKTVNKIYDKDTEELGEQIDTLKNEQEKGEKSKNYVLITLLLVSGALIFISVKYFRKQKNNKARFKNLITKITELESKESNQDIKIKIKDTTNQIVIDDQKVNMVLKGLDRLERQEYFLNSDCNLRAIAKKVKTNATYLSKIINTHKGKNFNDYINDLRIDYALKRLKNDKKFRSFSIASIATEIGYKSDNSFTKHFKTKTGLNPSYYVKNIEKLEQ